MSSPLDKIAPERRLLHDAMLKGRDEAILTMGEALKRLDRDDKTFLIGVAIHLNKPIALRFLLEDSPKLLSKQVIRNSIALSMKTSQKPERLETLAVIADYYADKTWLYEMALWETVQYSAKEAFRHVVAEGHRWPFLEHPALPRELCAKTHDEMALFVVREYALSETQKRRMVFEALKKGKTSVLKALAEEMKDFTWLNDLQADERSILEGALAEAWRQQLPEGIKGIYNFMYDHGIRLDMRAPLLRRAFRFGDTAAIKEFCERPLPVALPEILEEFKDLSHYTLYAIGKVNETLHRAILRLAVGERQLPLFTDFFVELMSDLSRPKRTAFGEHKVIMGKCALVLDILTREEGALYAYRAAEIQDPLFHQAALVMAEQLGHDDLYEQACASYHGLAPYTWDQMMEHYMGQLDHQLERFFEKNEKGFFLMHHLARSGQMKALIARAIAENKAALFDFTHLTHETKAHDCILKQMRNDGRLDDLKNPLLWVGRESELLQVSAYIKEKGLSRRWREDEILSQVVQLKMQQKTLPAFRLKKRAP